MTRAQNAAWLISSEMSAWISPEGEIVPCEFYAHGAKAESLVSRYPEVEKSWKSPEDMLVELGWLRLSRSFGDHFSMMGGLGWDGNITATQAQLNLLWDIKVSAEKVKLETKWLDVFFTVVLPEEGAE